MANINEIKNGNGEVVYPVTSTNAVYHTDGTNINSRIGKIDGVEVGAQVNDIEVITVNGGAPLPITNKIVNIPISLDGYVTEEVLNDALVLKTDATVTNAIDARVSATETKLETIATGAEVNVQADWAEVDNTSDAFILNKPTIPSIAGLVTTEQLEDGLALKADDDNVIKGVVLNDVELIKDGDGKVSISLSDYATTAALTIVDNKAIANATAIDSIEIDVAANEASITAIEGRIDVNEASISTINNNVATNVSSINTLSGRVSTNETAILTINESLSELADGKVASVTGSNSISIDGTSVNPIVNLKLDKVTPGNVTLSITDNGLTAMVPEDRAFDVIVMDERPDIGSSEYMYLIPVVGESNVYEQWVYAVTDASTEPVTRSWVSLGLTIIDLTDYYNKIEIDGLLSPITSKLATIEENAEVNLIETISINNVKSIPDAQRNINIDLSTYLILGEKINEQTTIVYSDRKNYNPILEEQSRTCELNEGNNTGFANVTYKDVNPLSTTYEQVSVVKIEDLTNCPLP